MGAPQDEVEAFETGSKEIDAAPRPGHDLYETAAPRNPAVHAPDSHLVANRVSNYAPIIVVVTEKAWSRWFAVSAQVRFS